MQIYKKQWSLFCQNGSILISDITTVYKSQNTHKEIFKIEMRLSNTVNISYPFLADTFISYCLKKKSWNKCIMSSRN